MNGKILPNVYRLIGRVITEGHVRGASDVPSKVQWTLYLVILRLENLAVHSKERFHSRGVASGTRTAELSRNGSGNISNRLRAAAPRQVSGSFT